MTRADSRRLAGFPTAAILLVALGGGVAAGSDEVDSMAVSEKVRATMRIAVEESSEVALRTARLGADVADLRSNAGAGSPTLSWQRDGIGSSFDRRPNAVDYLRITLPFNPPWMRGASRSLQEATDRLLRTGEVSSSLEVAALAGRRWLDLAAEIEMAELAETRVVRLDKSLAIQTRRYELGEISGSERAQLELELARDRALLRQSEAGRLAAEQLVAALAPGGFPLPASGDLGRLVESTASASFGGVSFEETLAEAPLLRLARIRSEVASAEARNERHTAWGRPEVEFEWEQIPNLESVAGFDAAGVRIAFPLPFGKQGRQKVLATQLRADAAVAEQDRFERALVAQLNSARETARSADEALASLQESADQLGAWEHSLAEQFRLGAVSYVVYFDGLSRLDEVRRTMIETRYTLLVARLELAQLQGADTYFPLPELDREGS